MEVESFINPTEVEVEGTKFKISGIPAIPAQEIYGAIVKETGEYGDIAMTFLPTELSIRLLGYAAYKQGEVWISFGDDAETINRVFGTSVLKLIKLQAEIIRKNFDFLFAGGLRKLLAYLRGTKGASSKQA